MTARNKRLQVAPTYDNMTAVSDNTQVRSPYRIQQEIESRQKRPSVDVRSAVLRLRREQEEQELREREEAEELAAKRNKEREDEDRRRRNAEYYERKEAEKLARYEREKKQNEEYSALEEKLKDDLYETEYKQWLEDVQKNPTNYSENTQAIVKRAMHSYKHPNDYLARLDRGLARALFGLKNRAGNVAYNSIDTNGTRYQGEISLRQHALDAAKVHQNRVGLELYKLNLLDSLKELVPGSEEYNNIQNNINQIDQLLNDPTSKQLDDDYKLNYVINKSGVWDLMKKTWRNYISGFTYDQYKDYVAQRNYKQDVNQYYDTVVNEGNKYLRENKKGSNANRTLASYTPQELLNVDSDNTNRRIDELTAELDKYKDLYLENRQHLADSEKYWQVSEYFKHGVNAHQNDPLTSLGYWGYSIYPMIGSTASSPEQLMSTVGQLGSAAGFASTPYTGGVGTVAGVVAGLGAGYYGIQSGFAENTTEAGDKRIDNFKELISKGDRKKILAELIDRSANYWKNRGWSEELINDYLKGETGINHAVNDYLVGATKNLVDEKGNPYVFDKNGNSIYTNAITNPTVRNAELYSTQGLNALYDADNARTVVGNIFQTLVSITPTGSMRKAASMYIDKAGARFMSKELAEEVAADGAGRVTAKAAGSEAAKEATKRATGSAYSNGFAKKTLSLSMAQGFERGAAVGEMAGFGLAGEVVGGSVGALSNAAVKLGIEKLPTRAKNLFRTIEEGVMHKYLDAYDKLLPNSKFGKAAAIYGARIAKTSAASMMSEAAEEAVQYLNSKENYASKYGWNGMSIGDAIINDIYQGARVFNSYGALLGITNSDLLNDAEYWSNVQGGFALGGLHTGFIRVASEGYNAYRELPVHKAILESAVMNRELDNKDRAANVEFARQAMRKRSNETLEVLDWMERNDSRRKDPTFSQEDYDEKRFAAKTIAALTENKRIREGLLAKGIVYGTEEYANAIADIYSINRLRQLNIEESKEKDNDINRLWNSPEYRKEADEIVNHILASSFEEHIGRGTSIMEAGNKAVDAEIARAKSAGENTETSEFKKHLQNIRREAQEAHAREIDEMYRQNIIGMSHTAHKLLSLIKLRAQHNTITDFFTFLKDKFNINPKRPDAKLIVKNVDDQIDQAKKDLAEFDEDFDVNMSDAAILDYIKTLNIVNAHSDDIERHEIAAAMLQADRVVIDKHAQMFEYGLIKNKDGKLEYNPAAYKAKQQRQKQLNEDLRSGKITIEQYATMSLEELELPAYNEKDVENNPYKRRILAIIDTRKDNEALNWMVNDIEDGDGVTKILDELSKEEYKEDNSDEVKTKAKEESETLSFEADEEIKPETTSPTIETGYVSDKKESAKEKYERRKAKADKKYKERKKTLRDLRKRAYATMIPIPTSLLDIANYLISKAEIATYKIAQFAEELSAEAKKRGFDANTFLSGIKFFYIDKLVLAISEDPSLQENFSSTEEIKAFTFGDVSVHQSHVSAKSLNILDIINKDAEAIDQDLSTHYDIIVKEGNSVSVYPNEEAIINARFPDNGYRNDTITRLTAANVSDESFRSALEEEFKNFNIDSIPVDKYVKYRNVDGIIQAIANRRWNLEGEQSVIFGKLMRNTVLAIMFNREDLLGQHVVSDPAVYEEFRKLVLAAYNKLTSKENGMGLTVIDCNRAIYGTDHEGKKVSSEADIIATDGTKLYAIDIRYSFQSLRLFWNHKYPRATFTIREHVTRRLKLIELIINTKFRKGVNGLYCLGVVYDPDHNILTVDIDNGNYFIDVKPDTQDEHTETIEESIIAANNVVSEINKNIDEYNILAEEANKYTGDYQTIDNIQVQLFETVQEYVNYLDTLHANYDYLVDKIVDLRTIINQNLNLYSEVWNSMTNSPLSVQDLPDIQLLYVRLKEICADLDLVLDEIPSLKVTTQAERLNIDKLVETIFDAQYLLDTLLNNPETRDFNFRLEEELIATAMEKMAENKDNFGKAAMFVRRWWATRFTIGTTENTDANVRTESDIFFGYYNKINSWIDTLRNHVLSDIQNNYDIQEWYSALLNNYFSKLLDNAEQYAALNLTDAGQLASILIAVRNGRSFIEEFNSLYDTRPEEGFDGPSISPEVDRINRMPVRWMDKWSMSDSIMPAFDQMTDWRYYYLSISPTFLDSKFVLSKRKDGTLLLYIEGTDINGERKYVTLTFDNDISKAKNNAERWEYVNKARQKFIRKAIAALDFVETHPGYKVVFDKSTDKGLILYDRDGKLRPVTDFLFAEDRNKQDLYTIKLSKQNRIGMLVTLKGDNAGPDTYSVRGGNNLTEDIGGFDRDYVKLQVHTLSGAIVYFYDTGNGQYIGSPIQATTIGEDASRLVYLIQKYIEGNRVDQYGFNIMELLKMRLYMADPERRLTSRNNTTNMITIQGTDVIIGNTKYNIITNKADLVNKIALMPNVTRAIMMNESLRTSDNSVISRVRTLFGQGGQLKMQLTNGLVFDIDDFTHKNNNPNAQDGSTWLGYMLRNGLLGSSANKLGYKELRISNLRVLPEGFELQKSVEKEILLAKQQKPKVVVKADDFFERLRNLKKIVDESDIDLNRGTEEQESFKNSVIEYFNKVLGINGKVDFGSTDEKFFGAVSKNGRIVGICTDEMIKLSRFVPMSVAWHEAFHKIFELVIPANERDAFYDAYKHSLYGRFKKPSDRDIAEAFADMFMTYMQNKEAIDRADTFFKKAKSWIKSFAFNLGMNFKIGKEKSKEMYELYHKMNEGKYKNTQISLEQHDRFKRLFGEGLYYTVTNIDSKTTANFSHISDVGEKDKLVRSLAYYILKSYEIDGLNPNVARVRITGGTENMKPTPDRLAEMYDGAIIEYLKQQHPVFEEVFEKVEKEYTTKDGKVVKKNFYPKFEALSRDIADYVGTLFDTMRKPKVEEDDSDDQDAQSQTGEALDFKSRDTDHWDKAAYEFSKLDGLIDEVKVFFGTIPYGKYVDETDDEGNTIRSVQVDYSRNEFGTPEFMPINEVYQLMVKKFHDITSIEDLDKALEEWSTVKEVYAQVYQKFHELVYGKDGKSGIYKKNEDGDYIIAQTNFDRESRALAILSAISSQPLTFLVALSQKQKDDEDEGKSTRIVESSLDRDSRSYPDQWTRYLVSGQIGVFQRERGEGYEVDSQGRRKKTMLLFREGMGGKDGKDIFSRTSKFLLDVRNALSSNNSEFEIDGIKYNSNIFDDTNRLKDEIVHRLCTIGIMFERDALDYMLSELYGGVDIEALTRLFMDSPASNDPQVQEDAKKQTITSFIDKLNQFVSDGGVVNQDLVENKGYGDIGFVNKLAKYLGQYRRMSTQSMALALNGKKLFTISQNNTISHIIKQLNTFDLQNDTVNVLSGFGFNVTRNEAGLPIGSIILKAIQDRKPLHLEGFTYIGFKTDNKGDQGSEYTEESTVEDYIAKMTMLQQGYLIFPTLADKGTWMLINGVPIPGMRFVTSKNEDTDSQVSVVMDAPTVKVYEGKPYLIPNDAVLDLMIEYAKCEMLGIQQCMEDLGYDDIPGYEKQGRHILSDDEKIVNYHTANGKVEPNGTRFLSLTKVITNEYDDKAHKYKLVTHNLNDPREDSKTLLKRAQDVFFARRDGETIEDMITRLRETMALTLAIQTQHEVNTAAELGIVEKVSYSGKFGNKTLTISREDESIQNLDSKNLNISLIKALLSHIMRTTRTKSGELWKDVTDSSKYAFYSRNARSLAIAAILQDATIRHIICSQEVQRCFSGHPALFKVKYGKTSIKDSAYDIQKRIGGMVSTGEDNILGIPGVKSEYTCAECEDYEVGSTSNVANRLESLFSDSQARHVFGLKTGLWDDAYKLSIDELKEKYPERADLISRMQQEGRRYAKAFTGGINVADGSAYITADMCRDMLRMRGAYNNKVREAFKILMSKTKYDWIKSADAYETIYKALNIVPTKYTAYGFRRHTKNGEQLSDIAVAYYNKFALFPIFPCMATGKMSGVYDKMVKEGVDMLLMTSAIKVGSQGAVNFDGETISEPFNKYTQSYAYLRRLMGTDPEEKEEQPIGTQMMKIGLANLVAERTYVDEDGNEVTGSQLLDDFMGSINSLADIGLEELRTMFFDEDDNIDYEKVSEYLKDLLTSRNANKTLILSIQVVTDPATGKKKLAAPLAATTDAQWIESIFISTMNKKVVDINIPGNSFIQRSVFLMEGDNELDLTLNNGQKLQMINEEGTMDIVITIDYFKNILPEGLSFEQARLWLIDQGIISGVKTGETEWSNAKSMMIGYRIPTQAQSSIHALRIVDVLLASKNSIIVPEEFTKITGADFDIDHLYLASYNYKKDENGNLTKDFDQNSKEYYQNRILRSLLTLLRDTENSLNSLYKPIDNDTELITDISDQIPEYGSTKDEPYNFGTLHEQVIRKNDYITGKNGIAPFALNSTSHMLCRQFGVGFRKSKLVQGTRLLNMDTVLDKDDNFVSSWLSGFINAHVDIVKDPYISKLDVNPFTYNMLNLMVRCGWGDTAVWFLANPVIRAMAEANNLADSQYMRRNNGDKSGRTYRQQLIYDALLKFLDEDEMSDETLNDLLSSKNSILSRIQIINWLELNQNKLETAAITGKMDHDVALTVFYAWKILEKYSIALGDLVQHTKVDTRKYGKNFISIARYYKEYRDLFYPEDPTTSIWDIKSLQSLATGSWIGKKTDYVASLPQLIFGNMTFSANDNFVEAVNRFATMLEYDGRKLYLDDVVNLAKHLQTAIKSKYFAGYARDVLKMEDKDIADLFIGYKSMNRQLVSLKDLISNNPNYKRLENNPFLNQIYSMLEDKPVFANGREMSDRPGFVTVLDNVDDSKLNSDLLSEGWLALMNDEDPRVSKFAKKFVIYAFFSSGEFKGWNKMLKYVPYEWIAGEVDPQYKSYSKWIEEQLENISEDYSDLYDDVVANNFMDYRFAAQMEEEDEDGNKNFLNSDRGVRIGKGVSSDQLDEVPEYVSIRKVGMRSGNQDSYDLFKKVGDVKVGKEYHPIYAKIKKRGYHTRGNDVYEYNWNFNYAENERKGSDTFDFDGAIKRVQEYVKSGAVAGFSESNIRALTKIFRTPEESQPVAPKAQTVEPGSHIATRGYKKGDPQKHPEFDYVFTENAQAYNAVKSGDKSVKINVSDVNGTNQAGIRTDSQGNITPNAYGIIVKKFLQNEDGKFVAQEGTFLDTDSDFEMFKSLNEEVFKKLEKSQNKVIVFPKQMALGKAALPKRFAEWLRNQLLDKFGVVSEVIKNERNDYEGYGLNILSVEPKESNLNQNREYDWKYEEDSGYSGALEELGLPEKVRIDGGMRYRPRYDFGRIYLTESEKEFITERIKITDELGNVQDLDAEKLNNIISSISKLYDKMLEPGKFKYKEVPYKEWKTMLGVTDWFDGYIKHHAMDFLNDWNGFSYDDLIGEYDKTTKNIKVETNFYDIVKILSENTDIVNKLIDVFGDEYYASQVLLAYENLYDAIEDSVNEEILDYGDSKGKVSLEYSYTDKRQLELFSDEDFEFDPSFEEHCKH